MKRNRKPWNTRCACADGGWREWVGKEKISDRKIKGRRNGTAFDPSSPCLRAIIVSIVCSTVLAVCPLPDALPPAHTILLLLRFYDPFIVRFLGVVASLVSISVSISRVTESRDAIRLHGGAHASSTLKRNISTCNYT